MERRDVARFTARLAQVGLVAIPLLLPHLTSAQEAEMIGHHIPYITHPYSPDYRPANTQDMGDSLRRIYGSINADRLIDEVHLADKETLQKFVGTDCVSAAYITSNGVNQAYFDREGNPKVLSVVRSSLREYSHLLNPNFGNLSRFYTPEEQGRLGILYELSLIPYYQDYQARGRTFGRGNYWAIHNISDPMARTVMATREVWAEVGERSFLDEPIPSEFDEMKELHAEIHYKSSGQTIEQSRQNLKRLFAAELQLNPTPLYRLDA